MTFEPGGDAHIPNQIGASGRSRSSGRPRPGTPQAFQRAILVVAAVNAVLIAAALVGVYVLELTDPGTGIWWILAAMVPGIILMTATVLRYQRQRAQYLQSPEGSLAAGSATAVSGRPGQASGYDTHQGAAPQQAGTSGSDGQFRFQAEEAFTITGRGTVVAGRVTEGEIRAGQTVAITREGRTVAQAAVSGVEVDRRMAEVARTGESAGLLLPGVDRSDVRAGDVVLPAGI